MGGGGSIQLARVFGIRVGASPSWFLILFLLIYLLSGYFADVLGGTEAQGFAYAVAAALAFFLSIVLHELGHAVAARRQGIETSGIDLWFFGGVARLSRDTRSPGEEFKVAAAGPAVTAVVVLLCLGAALALSRSGEFYETAQLERGVSTSAGVALLGWLATVNVFLLVFNLVPAFPLDGGRIARAAAWRVTGDKRRATRISARLGQAFSVLLIGGGLFIAVTADPFNGIWFMVLGWFLGQSASGALATSDVQERIDGVTAADLMDPEPLTLPSGTPAQAARDGYFGHQGWPWLPVVDPDGRFRGILERERVEAAAPEGRTVGDLLGPQDAERAGVRDTTSLEALLRSEPLARLGAVMVVDGAGRLRGVVTVEQVHRALAAAAPGRL
jgi:Zn-dependent protease